MGKRNLYIILAVICTFSVILLNSLISGIPPWAENSILLAGAETPVKMPLESPLFIFTTLIYTLIFFSGLVNLGIFFVRKITGRPAVSLNYPKKKFPLGQENTAKLIFLITFLLLLTYFLPNLFLYFSDIAPIYIILGTNLLLQLGAIFITFKQIRPSYFGLSIRKKDLKLIFQTYTAVIPIVVIAILINLFLLKIFAIKTGPSPIIKLVPLIQTKTSFFLFISQTVIFAPLAEEIVFRGIFYKLLREKYSFIISTIGLSLFFALLHRSPAGIIGLFVISFALCYVYEKTQKISAVFIFHMFHNLITLLFFLGTQI